MSKLQVPQIVYPVPLILPWPRFGVQHQKPQELVSILLQIFPVITMAFLLCSSTQALEPGCWVLNSGCAIFYLGYFRQFHNLSVLQFPPLEKWNNSNAGLTAHSQA